MAKAKSKPKKPAKPKQSKKKRHNGDEPEDD